MNSNSIHGNAMNDNSLTKIQRLIDGELDHGSRSTWLRQIDDDSEQWKQIALAFVEKQIVSESLAGFGTIQCPAGEPVSTIATMTKTDTTDFRRASVKWSSLVAGFCACLVGSFLFGLSIKNSTVNPANDQVTSNRMNQQSTGTPQPAVVSTNSSTLAAEDSQPLITQQLSDALSRSPMAVSDEFRRALLRAGYAVNDNRKIAEVRLHGGQPLKMPVRQIDVEYVGLKAFQ